MEIQHFPEVQIHGNNAKVRKDGKYVDLGTYDGDGVFEWSPEGAALRDIILNRIAIDAEVEAGLTQETLSSLTEKTFQDLSAEVHLDLEEQVVDVESSSISLDDDPELAAAKARNAARLKKQKAKAK